MGLEGAPVRWLECMSRTLMFPSADHEGGSGPAHPQVAFPTGMLACKAEGCCTRWQRKADCRFRGRTCQIVGIEIQAAQIFKRGP